MFDTMTLTKIGAALCGSLLIFLLGAWAAETIYHVGGDSHGGDHGETAAQGNLIEVPEPGTVAEVEEELDVAAILAAGDATAGEGLWRNCRACHSLEAGTNGTSGPGLYGVVGRNVGTADGFGAYSGALNEVADAWTAENLFGFLENPKGYAPGTTMNFRGLSKVTDRADLIAYLDSLDG
jgi:cytochrome c